MVLRPAGCLIITTTQAVEIAAFGFAGSIIDHFVGSTDLANSRTVRRFTRAWTADGCTLGTLVCVALAVTIGG